MQSKKNFIKRPFKKGSFKPPKDYAQKIPLIKASYLGAGLSLLSIIFVLLFKKNLPPVVPLFYGLAKGEEQLASNTALVIPSISSLIIIGLNSGLSYFLKSDLLQKTLVLAGLATSILTTITTVRVALLVGSF